MIVLKLAIIAAALITVAHADCPITENPKQIVECLRYLTSGLYGAAINDVNMICGVAVDVLRCAKAELGECLAAEVGRAALNEISSLAEHCCPVTNTTKCPIRHGLFAGQRCFAADSYVTLANGEQKSIVDLQPGDVVLAYDDKTKKILATDVLTMLDKEPTRFAVFKQLTTVSGRQLSLTSSHLLFTDTDDYVMAKNVRVGMNIFVMGENGQLASESIVDVVDVVKQGYAAPLTQEGTIIVNHLAASCYATINSHYLAHAAMAPMRWWFRWFGKETFSNDIIGIHWFPKMLYEMTVFVIPSVIHQ